MRYALLFLFACTLQTAFAQADTLELGIRFSSLDNFNLLYKKRLADGRYRRYDFVVANVALAAVDEGPTIFQLSAGASIGTERRRTIAPRFKFVRGWQPGLSLGLSMAGETGILTVSPRIAYLLGFQYDVSDRFYVSVEALPSASLNVTVGDITTVGINAGISSTGVGLTAVYRFVPER